MTNIFHVRVWQYFITLNLAGMESHFTYSVVLLNLVVVLVAAQGTQTPIPLSNNQAGSVSSNKTETPITISYSYEYYTTTGTIKQGGITTSKTRNSPDGVILSNPNNNANELFSYSITPSKSDVRIGDSYALTCRTNSSNGLDQLTWIMTTESQITNKLLNCDEQIEEGFKCNIREFPNGLFSVLNVTTSKHSSGHYHFHCRAQLSLLAMQQQPEQLLGEAVVTVHPSGHMLETELEVAGGTLFVLAGLMVAFLVFQKGRIRSAFGGVRDI